VLVILSGLPGTGKTTLARLLATTIGAVHLRIDSIEQALRNLGREVGADGYVAAHAIAEDNLRLGHSVIADCVNPWPLTRAEWRSVAARAGVRPIEFEVVCSDVDEHRHRVESRVADIPGHRVPTWAEVLARDYRAWETERTVIDTARSSAAESVQVIVSVLKE
jgi:predicted kinase